MYIAPEKIENEYSYPSDIWSCGIIMYVLLSGRTPFNGDNEKLILRSIYKYTGTPNFSISKWDSISKPAKELICWMLKANPKERPTAQQVLEHNWFDLGMDIKDKV